MSEERAAGFTEKILKVLDGTIEAEEFVALDRWIAEHPDAGRHYVEVLLINLALSQSAELRTGQSEATNVDSELDQLLAQLMKAEGRQVRPKAGSPGRPKRRSGHREAQSLRQGISSSEQERVKQIRLYAQQQLDAFLQQHREQEPAYRERSSGSWDLVDVGRRAKEEFNALTRAGIRGAKIAAVCASIAVVILTVGLYLYSHRVVATIVDSTHTQWGSEVTSENLRPGRMRLEEGYVHLAFKKGAEILLQAPCEFRLLSSNHMSLTSGRMTANVPGQAKGFTVETPASAVVDYGTEFGLLVGTAGESEVHVFAGEVGLSPLPRSRDGKFQTLTTGEAARVEPTGAIRLDTTRNRPGLFMQKLPPEDLFGIPGRRLDLADVLRGGSGFGTGREDSVICMGSGQFVPGGQWLDDGWRSAYAPVHALSFVDGVFVPDGSEGPVIVSSAGHRFGACPDTDGMMRNGFVSAGTYRSGQPLRVDLSQSGEVEPGWTDWSTGERLGNARLTKTFTSAFDRDFTVTFDRVDTRNRGQVDASVPLHDLLDDDFKEENSVVMRIRDLDPGTYVMTTYHHDPLEDSKDSDGTISITLTDARNQRVVAQRFWQSWGPTPKVVACATFAFESDGREVVLTFKDNNDATHNEAHVNGFELDILGGTGGMQTMASRRVLSMPSPGQQSRLFGTRAHPAIYMHANAGVTFDLEPIRESLSGARVVAFQTQCGLMTPPPDPQPYVSRAGFWVLVDGRIRFRHIEENPGIATSARVELSDHDRFLTLVTTDGGDGHESDLCFFGDPALTLESAG